MTRIWNLVSSRGGRSAVAAAVVLLAGIGAVNLDPRTENERAEAWAAAHGSSLPKSIAAFAAYPESYRTAILEVMPAADKSRLWREHLQFVLDHEPLNNAQRTFIEKTLALVTPESFEPNRPKPELCADIASLFATTDQREKLTKLGSVAPPARGVWSTIAQASELIHRTVGLNARRLTCNCRGGGLCECGLTQACVNELPCQASNNCGCIWAGPCDSYCETVILNNLGIKK